MKAMEHTHMLFASQIPRMKRIEDLVTSKKEEEAKKQKALDVVQNVLNNQAQQKTEIQGLRGSVQPVLNTIQADLADYRKHTDTEALLARSERSAENRKVIEQMSSLSSQVKDMHTALDAIQKDTTERHALAVAVAALATSKRLQDESMAHERNSMAVAMAETSTTNRIQGESMAHVMEFAQLLTQDYFKRDREARDLVTQNYSLSQDNAELSQDNAELLQENASLSRENTELKRRLHDQERNEERPSQRIRTTLPQVNVDDIGIAYGDLEKIPVFQPETGIMIPFNRLHLDVKASLLRWSRSHELKGWYKLGLLRRATCVGTAWREPILVPRDLCNVACDYCVSKKAFCIRRWSSDSETLCLYPLHSTDRGEHVFESVSFWILSQQRLSKQLYSSGVKLTTT
jgi:regulator of replication initiation timing